MTEDRTLSSIGRLGAMIAAMPLFIEKPVIDRRAAPAAPKKPNKRAKVKAARKQRSKSRG